MKVRRMKCKVILNNEMYSAEFEFEDNDPFSTIGFTKIEMPDDPSRNIVEEQEYNAFWSEHRVPLYNAATSVIVEALTNQNHY